MAGKKGQDELIPKIANRFVRELQETSGEVIQELTLDRKIPIKQVYEGHVHGAFLLLQAALRAKRKFQGKPSGQTPVGPMVMIREREEMMRDMMDLVGEELATIDPYHEYSVLVAKRERGAPGLLE